jgi:hypothetical protein
MDKAAAKLSLTLEKMGSGTGNYWMEDSFKDPMYRCMILDDLVQLSKHMDPERGYTLIVGTDAGEKPFMPLDIEKAELFMAKNAKISQSSVVGVLHGVQSKRSTMYGFAVNGERAKISFRSKEAEDSAAKFVNNPVLVTGTLRYSDDGELIEAADVVSVALFNKKTFTHMISAGSDIPLAVPVEASVKYENSSTTWKLSCPDLGISVSDQDWDTAVAEFHDYFVFLWDNYSSKNDDELSDEEKEVKELLTSLVNAKE